MTKNTDYKLKTYRFTTEAYHQLGAAGILPEDKRVELINGEIIEMSPINSRHAGTVNLLSRLLNQHLSMQYILSVQNPIHIEEYSEPEPDLAILSYREDFYSKSHPRPKEVVILIEVADTSLEKDRLVKLPLYAAAEIQEVWIVNLPEQQVEIYTHPVNERYTQLITHQRTDTIEHQLAGTLKVEQIIIEE
ncbi:MAG: Uma2 family endonuclease [Chitinophagales bacterium]|nr:Uma2 family endonuclease [Chitinophagales bacterium]